MTREGSTSTFLFRPTVLVKQVDRLECVSEEEAISALYDFLKTVGPNIVLVGLDEETVGLLVEKLRAKDKAKFGSLVTGYTWWKRILERTNLKHR